MDIRYICCQRVWNYLPTHHKPWKAEYHMSPCFSSKDKCGGVGVWWGDNKSLLTGIKTVRLPRKDSCFNYV